MLKNHRLIIIYIVAHFAVDFACAFLLYRILYHNEQWYLCLLVYNFCAFALQMPIGLLSDKWNRNAVCAAIGCGLIALSYGFGSIAVLTAILAGIGNSMFHIGGGIDVLNVSRDNPTLLGVFVSPGALGIYLGTILGKQGIVPGWLVVVVVIIFAIAILAGSYAEGRSFQSDNSPVSLSDKHSSGILLSMVCLLIVVCLRAYIGMIYNFSWKSMGGWSSIVIAAVVLGKMSGGFLAGRIGVVKASILSLGLAAVLFLFSDIPILGILAILLFNMTMPMTLWAMAKLLPGSKGFAFGILTFGLFMGFVPVYLEFPAIVTTVYGFAFAAIISLILLLLGLRKEVFK